MQTEDCLATRTLVYWLPSPLGEIFGEVLVHLTVDW